MSPSNLENRFQTLHEIVRAAKLALAPGPWDYLVGGTETETTLRRNRQALDSIAFRPRVLRDVSKIDTLVDVARADDPDPGHDRPGRLDRELRGRWRRHRRQAAAEFGVAQMLSSVCNPGLEAVAAAAESYRIFQLYVRGDDAWVDDHVKRAIDHGYTAFCLTVDTAHLQPPRARHRQPLREAVARARDRLRLPGRAHLGSRQALQGPPRHPADPEGHRHRGGRGARLRPRRRRRLRVEPRRTPARPRARLDRRAAGGGGGSERTGRDHRRRRRSCAAPTW